MFICSALVAFLAVIRKCAVLNIGAEKKNLVELVRFGGKKVNYDVQEGSSLE